eukprot:Skav226902  [mRNA]  locus=scaffold853:11397:14706:- [translate_table: standard]
MVADIIWDGDYCWLPTEIQRCSDLVDGGKWINTFESMLQQESRESTVQRPRRCLRSALSDGDAPQFWTPATAVAANVEGALSARGRNEVLRKMHSPPARKVVLPNKQEVLFWLLAGCAGWTLDRGQGPCHTESSLQGVLLAVKRATSKK